MTNLRIGHGYDVHRFAKDRDCILGGVRIPYEKGLLGHSDADVLVHAVMDALLGAAALGDIGGHFPDTDERYAGADSLVLTGKVRQIFRSMWMQPFLLNSPSLRRIFQKCGRTFPGRWSFP